MIIRPREYLGPDGLPSDVMLRSVVQEHDRDTARLRKLRDYYGGKTPITERRRGAGLPNNRLAHPMARYIVNITSGYLAGEPVGYSTSDEDTTTLDAVLEGYKRVSMSSVDVENARNAAIYGKGVEYVHVDDELVIHASALSPIDAFVVYDDTHESKPLFGVYKVPKLDERGSYDGCNAWIMGEQYISHIVSSDQALEHIVERSVTQHFFGGVPLVEYWNGDDERGDFECVLSLMDAYDTLESDRVNDKEQFVDALLVLTGCTMDVDEQGRTPAQQLRESKSLSLPDIDAKAEYLTNSLHESDIDILRTAIAHDIHKLSMVPDLSDENFASNSSGVAMRYKLLGLEQITNIKEQWFKEGLRSRLKLVLNFMYMQGYPEMDVADVDIQMSRALPANELENAQIVQQLRAASASSTDTLVRILHSDWSEDAVEAEVRRIEGESDARFSKLSELQTAGAISKAELRASVMGEDVEDAQRAIDDVGASGEPAEMLDRVIGMADDPFEVQDRKDTEED